jgi:hypothetical protein
MEPGKLLQGTRHVVKMGQTERESTQKHFGKWTVGRQRIGIGGE